MPPIPVELDVEISSIVDNLHRRQSDLANFQIPRLKDCKENESTRQRYAAEIKEDLDAYGHHIESLDILADDITSKNIREVLKQKVTEFREAGIRLRKEARSALLSARAKYGRDELLQLPSQDEKRNVEDKATDDAVMKASHDVTDSMKRTIALMQSELERSVLSSQLLEQSSATLRATSTQHDVLSSVTHTSRQLIRILEKADWVDRMLISAGLIFFLLVVAFILKQRIFNKGIRLAFWWTRFLPSSSRHSTGSPAPTFSGDTQSASVDNVIMSTIVSAMGGGVTSVLSAASSVILESTTSLASEVASESAPSLLLDITSETLIPSLSSGNDLVSDLGKDNTDTLVLPPTSMTSSAVSPSVPVESSQVHVEL